MIKIDKKTEAIKRMEILKLFPPCIEAFKKRNEVQLSEPTGALYEFNDDEKLNKIVKDFEEKFNGLVYHVIHTYTNFGELYNLLYVSDTIEEWEIERKDMKDGYVFVWCENISEPLFSEFGTIGVGNRFGGLVRNY